MTRTYKAVVTEFYGSKWTLVFWTIVFFPLAIVYYFLRRRTVFKEVPLVKK
jgi:hypothetical protein